jgi:hypothetical protein
MTYRRSGSGARGNDTGNSRHKSPSCLPAVELSTAPSAAAGCYSDTPVMCPLDWTLHIPELPVRRDGISLLELLQQLQGTGIATRQKRLPPASPYPATRPQGSPGAGLSLDRTGNGRPSQTRDLVKPSGRLWVVPFLNRNTGRPSSPA